MTFLVEKKSNISFGTTLNREVYPTHVPHTRFGNDLKAIRGQPNTGPGCYNNEEVGNMRISRSKFHSNRHVFFVPLSKTSTCTCVMLNILCDKMDAIFPFAAGQQFRSYGANFLDKQQRVFSRCANGIQASQRGTAGFHLVTYVSIEQMPLCYTRTHS